MPGREPSSEDSGRDAQEVYSAYLRNLQKGEEVNFEEFCAPYSDMAEDLRKLHWSFQLGQSLATSRPFHHSIRERFGDVEAVTISLEMDSSFLPGLGGDEKRDSTSATTATDSRYEPEGEVARGGMGVIYRIRDRDLNRTIAMKVMLTPHEKEGEASVKQASQFLARFLEEAQITAQLDHPGIVPVHELGFDSEGFVYFTMKLVKGRELGEISKLARERKEGWNLPRAVGVLIKACQAVAFGHAKRVIHRDLKPSNIMVGRFGEVYVMDWGLAKIVGKKDLHDIRLKLDSTATFTTVRSDRRQRDEGSAESALITMDGSVVGTPAYMPPEQAEGRVEEVDRASDVYSLGAILYTLLTGQAPYINPGARLSPRTILGLVTQGPPKRIHELNPEASLELAAICEKAMAREKKERYRSSLELAEDLQAYLDHRVVRAYRTGAIAEFRSWVARNRSTAAVSATALVLLIVGLVSFLVTQHQKNEQIAGQKDLAQSRLAEVLRLSDIKRLGDYQNEAENLWPCIPDKVAAMEAWLIMAKKLAERLETHRENIVALRERALDYDIASKERDRASHPEAGKLEEVRESRRRLRDEMEQLQEVVGEAKVTLLSYGEDAKKKRITACFRHVFNLTDRDQGASEKLDLKLRVDDGAVVYLNRNEILRVNMPPGQVGFQTKALKTIKSAAPRHFEVPGALLRPGKNLLAVEVHQAGARSSDILFSLQLAAEKTTLISNDAVWRYNDSGQKLGVEWKALTFDDSGWHSGPAPLGLRIQIRGRSWTTYRSFKIP